ncbi:hypothetical protein EMPS_05628 [Entomortierella parvispora]|uniref:Phosphoglycerate mutase family protein n=1 Tax=Entomortierella parvispora TaxID=205924 RepID=A0A9P3LWY0_9FUNG|nr:hypothetical protein EMPS_05628 [Entomortierella parvispora]
MKVFSLLAMTLVVLTTAVAARKTKHTSSSGSKPIVYLIRHGEKPSNDGVGLNPTGEKRAQCLRKVFGADSKYKIGFIMAQKYKKNGKRSRPFRTVEPLGKDLGITIDTSCDRDDAACVEKTVKKYKGSGNILICWEHDALTEIVKTLGDNSPPDYPSNDFGLIWTDPAPYGDVTSITNENCPGLGN